MQDVACLTEGCKEETERLVTALQGVRSKLAPWEARAADVQSKLDVAAAERGALVKEHEAAKAQLKVRHTTVWLVLSVAWLSVCCVGACHV